MGLACLTVHPVARIVCAVFGNVTDPASAFRATGTDTAIDLYIENTTYYPNWVCRAASAPLVPPPPPERAPCDVALPHARRAAFERKFWTERREVFGPGREWKLAHVESNQGG